MKLNCECPKCGKTFKGRDELLHGFEWKQFISSESPIELMRNHNLIRCPFCHFIFRCKTERILGIFTPKQLEITLIVLSFTTFLIFFIIMLIDIFRFL